MNVQTTPAAIALAPLKSGQQDDRSLGTSKTDNAIPIEAWNTVLFEKFCRFRHIMSLGLAGHSDELFRRKSIPAGARVLDIGFGFGDTTRLIAAQVAPNGDAVGVDGAQNFTDLATREAAEAGLNPTFRSLAPMRKATIFAVHTITRSRDSARCFSICRELRCATSGARSRQAAS